MAVLQIDLRKSNGVVRSLVQKRARAMDPFWNQKSLKSARNRRLGLNLRSGRYLSSYLAARRELLVRVYGYMDGTRRYWQLKLRHEP